jgi:hypothetical protein
MIELGKKLKRYDDLESQLAYLKRLELKNKV